MLRILFLVTLSLAKVNLFFEIKPSKLQPYAAPNFADMDLPKMAENGAYYAMKRLVNAMINELKWSFFRPTPKTGLPLFEF